VGDDCKDSVSGRGQRQSDGNVLQNRGPISFALWFRIVVGEDDVEFEKFSPTLFPIHYGATHQEESGWKLELSRQQGNIRTGGTMDDRRIHWETEIDCDGIRERETHLPEVPILKGLN
jgi:hypothetical protein